jgi:hypothetical protein
MVYATLTILHNLSNKVLFKRNFETEVELTKFARSNKLEITAKIPYACLRVLDSFTLEEIFIQSYETEEQAKRGVIDLSFSDEYYLKVGVIDTENPSVQTASQRYYLVDTADISLQDLVAGINTHSLVKNPPPDEWPYFVYTGYINGKEITYDSSKDIREMISATSLT